MSRRYRSRSRRRVHGAHPLVGFLLVASFGILFAGCGGPEDVPGDDIVFTADDIARFRDMADSAMSMSGSAVSSIPTIEALPSGSGSAGGDVTLDLSVSSVYGAMRGGAATGDSYLVTNPFLNVRAQPTTASESVAQLSQGDSVEVTDFVDGQWAKVKLPGGQEGYVAHRYVSKVTSDEKLEGEKKRFENMYYVSFGFVNMRKEANQDSEKLAEVPGNTIVRPSSVANGWAKITYDGKEGYVSTSYLARFEPNFIIRQETYELPVLHYRLVKGQEAEALQAMTRHIASLKAEGYSFITFADLRTLLQTQQSRDVRLEPKRVIVGVSGMTPATIRDASDALVEANINATLFIETENVGLSGITEKTLLTMMANGFDIQSATHTGDDLRAQTNAQAELELKQSRQILEDYTNKDVFAVAYPQGGINDRIAQIAAEAGYLFGIGDDADRSFSRSQFLRVPAMVVFPSMTVDEVTKFVSGS